MIYIIVIIHLYYVRVILKYCAFKFIVVLFLSFSPIRRRSEEIVVSQADEEIMVSQADLVNCSIIDEYKHYVTNQYHPEHYGLYP